jgi:nitroreductase
MDLRDAMQSAWTNRYYTSEPVDPAALHRLLDLARFAPSGGNRQGWRVIAVLDPQRRQRIAELYRRAWAPYRASIGPLSEESASTRLRARSLAGADHFAATLHEIPVHLLICVELDALALPDRELDRVSINGGASIYPFAHNILLAARAEGLGAALTTLICASEPEVKASFAIPDGQALAALMTIGHPVSERIPRRLSRRPVEEFATLDSFDGAPLGQ